MNYLLHENFKLDEFIYPIPSKWIKFKVFTFVSNVSTV